MIRLTRDQVREVDRRSIEQCGVPGVVLMEHAALALTREALAMSGGGPVALLCGGGNNGGDGLAAARLLHNAGATIQLLLAVDPSKYRGDAQIQWRIVDAMGLPRRPATAEAIVGGAHALLVDCLFGTGLSSAPRDAEAALIDAVNRAGRPVLACDIPSGLDCDAGIAQGACVVAAKTVTFVAEKSGFANLESRRYTGEVVVAGIGCPREVIDELLKASALTQG